MCRWLAYTGSPIQMDELLLKPEHSMIDQSRNAKESTYTINADGFGVGWYTDEGEPGLYHDVRPIWNDQNFAELTHHVADEVEHHGLIVHDEDTGAHDGPPAVRQPIRPVNEKNQPLPVRNITSCRR